LLDLFIHWWLTSTLAVFQLHRDMNKNLN